MLNIQQKLNAYALIVLGHYSVYRDYYLCHIPYNTRSYSECIGEFTRITVNIAQARILVTERLRRRAERAEEERVLSSDSITTKSRSESSSGAASTGIDIDVDKCREESGRVL